mmetsp:Transcript_547/g.654  ORF Transcript_547/g.654 Transcript_547/m.654 type:complete len:638 (+) Transcript_547:37-1950(+)
MLKGWRKKRRNRTNTTIEEPITEEISSSSSSVLSSPSPRSRTASKPRKSRKGSKSPGHKTRKSKGTKNAKSKLRSPKKRSKQADVIPEAIIVEPEQENETDNAASHESGVQDNNDNHAPPVQPVEEVVEEEDEPSLSSDWEREYQEDEDEYSSQMEGEDSDSDIDDDFCGAYDFTNSQVDDLGEEFTSLSPEDIVAAHDKQITEVAELLAIPEATAGAMLRYYRWKQESLLRAYFANPSSVLNESGCVTVSSKKKVTDGSSVSTKRIDKKGPCLICGDEKLANECTALRCKHRFCNSCWSQYLEMKIGEKQQACKLCCPAAGCNLFVGERLVKRLVSKASFAKYKRFITQSFVEENTYVSWCPRAGCTRAISADAVEGSIVKCDCGFRFCFTCHNEAHLPATCYMVRDWNNKCIDDSETIHWIGANTKDCPKCRIAVEKNGGCNHMTCRQCGYEWCWLCNRPWKGHNDYYTCNRFEKAQKKLDKKKKKGKKHKIQKEEEDREAQKEQLSRYLHYYERFLSHDHAAKNEKTIREAAQKKMLALTEEHSTLAEVQFIERGTERLLECHNVLKWSYAYGYYLTEEGPKTLFEFLQEELENTTQKLDDILENPGVMHRVDAVNLTKLAETRKNNLMNIGKQ